MQFVRENLTPQEVGQIFQNFEFGKCKNKHLAVLNHLRKFFNDPEYWAFKEHGGSTTNWFFMNKYTKATVNALENLLSTMGHPLFQVQQEIKFTQISQAEEINKKYRNMFKVANKDMTFKYDQDKELKEVI